MATRANKTFIKRFAPEFSGSGEGFIPATQFSPQLGRDSHLWTLVDPMLDSGMQYWVPGYHRVNRVGYVYTANPWTAADLADEYRRW